MDVDCCSENGNDNPGPIFSFLRSVMSLCSCRLGCVCISVSQGLAVMFQWMIVRIVKQRCRLGFFFRQVIVALFRVSSAGLLCRYVINVWHQFHRNWLTSNILITRIVLHRFHRNRLGDQKYSLDQHRFHRNWLQRKHIDRKRSFATVP